MASLLTSLCRVGGEQIHYRLDQPGYSVLSCLDIDPNAAPARGVGGYGTDAGDPCIQEQPPRLFLAERRDEVLHRRAGCEGNAVHLARLKPSYQLVPAFGGRDRLVCRRNGDLGAGFAQLLGQYLPRHQRARDEDLLPRERVAGQLPDQGLRPELARHHVNPQTRLPDPPRRRRTDRGYLRLTRHGPQVQPVALEALHEGLDAVHAGEDEPVEGVEVPDRRVERPEVVRRADLDGRELEDLRPEPLE